MNLQSKNDSRLVPGIPMYLAPLRVLRDAEINERGGASLYHSVATIVDVTMGHHAVDFAAEC